MKPLISETEDKEALGELGRASVQIVHDLKNQLNGLKLYATFLHKRLEKAERPADELETVAKLMSGLERAAADTNALVRYGRPVELRRAPHTDLSKLLEAAATTGGAPLSTAPGSYKGEFDAPALSEALKNITSAALPSATPTATTPRTSTNATTATATPTPQTTATDTANAASGERTTSGINLRREEDGAGAPFAVIEWSGTNFDGESDAFRNFAGGHGLRLALAARIIRAHGGQAEQQANTLRVRLPLQI